jgi:hypothetical protein
MTDGQKMGSGVAAAFVVYKEMKNAWRVNFVNCL